MMEFLWLFSIPVLPPPGKPAPGMVSPPGRTVVEVRPLKPGAGSAEGIPW